MRWSWRGLMVEHSVLPRNADCGCFGRIMIGTLKSRLAKTPLGQVWTRLRTPGRLARQIAAWEAAGRPVPPPHAYKARTVRRYAERFSTPVLIETGAFYGDMVFAVRDRFDAVYTIELDVGLHREVQQRFAGDPRIHVLQGDSGQAIGQVLAQINGRCLFWLDAHYSGEGTARAVLDSPIRAELRQIMMHPTIQPVILIDDARCFNGSSGYPTVEELKANILATRPDWTVEVQDDIVRAHAR